MKSFREFLGEGRTKTITSSSHFKKMVSHADKKVMRELPHGKSHHFDVDAGDLYPHKYHASNEHGTIHVRRVAPASRQSPSFHFPQNSDVLKEDLSEKLVDGEWVSGAAPEVQRRAKRFLSMPRFMRKLAHDKYFPELRGLRAPGAKR